MKIKRDHKREIEEWAKTNEIKKLKPQQIPLGQWSHVPYSGSGAWTTKSKPIKRMSKKKRAKLKRAQLNLFKKKRKNNREGKAKRLSDHLDREMQRAIDRD